MEAGRVEELLTGPDGHHRAAVLRAAGQGRTAKRLRRPVQRLYPVEMSVARTEPEDSSASSGNGSVVHTAPPINGAEQISVSEPTPPVRRSKPAAARTATDRLLAQTLASYESEHEEC